MGNKIYAKAGVLMWNMPELVIAFVIAFLTTVIVTPLIIKITTKYKIVDEPNHRKIHQGCKPSMGGLAVFIGAAAGFLYLQPVDPHMNGIIIGAIIMLITGILDDIFNLKPIYKLFGQTTAAIVVVASGLVIDKLTIPFVGTIYFDYFGIIITILWIVGASNAINLIDGLDGLAAGISAIALTSILVMAMFDGSIIVAMLTVILIGSCTGFLFFNFHPAKIFMGDTGALFLGYAIAIVSMLGLFKNVAFFSFIVPIVVIGIPIFDTTLAIIRRLVNKKGIAVADKEHIHYRLMKMGYSHKTTVLILYAFSFLFGCAAIIFNSATMLTSFVVFIIMILAIQLIMELAGITINSPLIHGYRKLIGEKEKTQK